MGSEWKSYPVSELCELIVDCVNKTAPISETPTAYKMIRTPNIREGRVSLEGCKSVSEDTFKIWTRRAQVKRGDVLLTREAPLGEVGIIDFEEPVFLGQRIMQYRADSKKILPEFLLYSFLSPALQNQFKMHDGTGSVVSHIRVPDCHKFEIKTPNIQTQERIVSILKSLDSKINVNNQTNQTLEEMAQAIFKSWFVDFDPVKAKAHVIAQGGSAQDANLAAMEVISGKTRDQLAALEKTHPEHYTQLHTTATLFPSAFVDSELGEIPEGWGIESISNHLDTVSKTFRFDNDKKVIFLNTGDIKEGIFLHGNLSDPSELPGQAKKSIRKNDILFSEIRPINRRHAYVELDSEDYVVSTKLMVLRSKGIICSRFLYFILTQNSSIELLQILAESRSGTFPQITFDSLRAVKLVIPKDLKILNLFSENYLKPKMEIFHQKQIESARLTELRDQLLPKLLSGEIDVSQLNLDN